MNLTQASPCVKVEIDPHSGFCFGVVTAINKAEEHLKIDGSLYCLGDIVHNNDEVARLKQNGLDTISHDDLETLHDVKVLLRAHGEPPSTYATARRNNICLVDATCPVVLKLQERIRNIYNDKDNDSQIVIYGKLGHAEVNGLVGQTEGKAIVIESPADLDLIDFTRNISLFSQTTKSLEGFNNIIEEIKKRLQPGVRFEHFDTICRQVSSRVDNLQDFARSHDTVIFVAGDKSSNGKILFSRCLEVNPKTYLTSNATGIKPEWLNGVESVGICGATSTPRWLMEKVRDKVISLVEKY